MIISSRWIAVVKYDATKRGVVRGRFDAYILGDCHFDEGSIALYERFWVLSQSVALFVEFGDQGLHFDSNVLGLAVHERRIANFYL